MVKLRIRKGNPSGRTQDTLVLMNSSVKVNDTDWTEIDDTEFKYGCINPVLYEVEGEKAPVAVSEGKPKKPK